MDSVCYMIESQTTHDILIKTHADLAVDHDNDPGMTIIVFIFVCCPFPVSMKLHGSMIQHILEYRSKLMLDCWFSCPKVRFSQLGLELYLRSFSMSGCVFYVAMTISIRKTDRQMDSRGTVPDVTANVGSAQHIRFETRAAPIENQNGNATPQTCPSHVALNQPKWKT